MSRNHHIIAAMICAAVIFAAAILPAKAEPICDRGALIQDLISGPEYGEIVLGTGLSGDMPVQVWVNPETGTFTIITLHPQGACAHFSGDLWFFGEPPAPGDPA